MMTPLPVALDFISLPDDPFSETTSIRTMAGYTELTALLSLGSAVGSSAVAERWAVRNPRSRQG